MDNKDIYIHGFAQAYKSVITDSRLSVEAKGVYLQLSLLTRIDHFTVTKKLKELYAALGIGNRTFRSTINELVSYGYVILNRNHVGTRIAANTYILVPHYLHYRKTADGLPEPKTVRESNMRNLIIAACSASNEGFGRIPRSVMLGNDLTAVQKVIYAYYATMAGNGNAAWPKQSDILQHLSISEDRFTANKRVLKGKGYICEKQYRKDGHFGVKLVTIVSVPSACCNADAPEQGMDFDTKESDTKEMSTSFFDNKQPSAKEQSNPVPKTGKEKKVKEDEYYDSKKNALLEKIYSERSLSSFISSYDDMTAAVRLITEPMNNDTSDIKSAAISDVFKRALKALLTTSESTVGNENVTKATVAAKINRVLELDTGRVSIMPFYTDCILPCYTLQSDKYEIKNPYRYMQTLILDKLDKYAIDKNTHRTDYRSGKTTSMPDLINTYDGILEDLFV